MYIHHYNDDATTWDNDKTTDMVCHYDDDTTMWDDNDGTTDVTTWGDNDNEELLVCFFKSFIESLWSRRVVGLIQVTCIL